ncbi:class I SAM-dependent methyltransferase [Streptomyces sp. AM2-3-1]|uniref:class I SAM-dependent methyltransferase n=1 Tax=Streptomyces sp. AM2-3-1 TaxID=3075824 RepID=UPI0028C50B77|nr:class I SAM-dependent methyltransferase [Streptomyces sp. AM2-3-1]WNO67451.1 class I SAM-dependent methyltransferase [Streptomyces sp. AM2-3-1]
MLTSGYDGTAARLYDQVYSGRARDWAPRILAFHTANRSGNCPKTVVDLCCGNGHLLRHFVDGGYTGYGVDISPDMLAMARKNLKGADPDRYHLIEADVSQVALPAGVAGLVVSTVDALNHLPGPQEFRSCVKSVVSALAPEGYFVFDLLTPFGLADSNQVGATVLEDYAVISRGVLLPEESRSHSRATGFLRRKDGLYERFDLNTTRYAFTPEDVDQVLREEGFSSIHRARIDDLGTPVKDFGQDERAFFVARR